MNTDIVLGLGKKEPDIVVNGMPLEVYVDQEHTKEIRQFRTEEVNNLSRIKRRNIKCCPSSDSNRKNATTRIFQKYEVKREEFIMNEKAMKEYDLANKSSVMIYLIYAIYEWEAIGKAMFEMKYFNNKNHLKFNLTSLAIFLKHRYGGLVDNGIARLSGDKTSSDMSKIYKALDNIGLIKRERISGTDSITHGYHYVLEKQFYEMPIKQIIGLLCKDPENVKDPNLLCLSTTQLDEKIKAYQNKHRMKEFEKTVAPKIKAKETIAKPVVGLTPVTSKLEEVEKGYKMPASVLEVEATLHKGVNFDEVIKIHNKYGIPMKELVIYPNGITKIIYI